MAIQFDSPAVLPSLPVSPGTTTKGVTPGAGFGQTLERMLQAVDETAGDANAAVGSMLDGSGDVHDAMIALQRAEHTLQLTVQVRNKLLTAYQEIMRMSV